MSNAFAALIWWAVPAAGLIGALGYVLWVTKFQGKFQKETQRSVGQFRRFQDSLRDSQARDVASGGAVIATTAAAGENNVDKNSDGISDVSSFDTGSLDTGSLDTGSLDTGSLDTGSFDTGSFDTGSFDTGSSN